MKKIIVLFLTLCCLLNIFGCVRTDEKIVFEQPYTEISEIHIIDMDAQTYPFVEGTYYNSLLECSIKEISISAAEQLYLDIEALPIIVLFGMEPPTLGGKCILIQYANKSFHLISLCVSYFYQYDINSEDFLEMRDGVARINSIHFEKSDFDALIEKYLNI